MICPVCLNKVRMTMRGMERVMLPHPHSEVVLVCPGSNRTAKEAHEVKKLETEA